MVREISATLTVNSPLRLMNSLVPSSGSMSQYCGQPCRTTGACPSVDSSDSTGMSGVSRCRPAQRISCAARSARVIGESSALNSTSWLDRVDLENGACPPARRACGPRAAAADRSRWVGSFNADLQLSKAAYHTGPPHPNLVALRATKRMIAPTDDSPVPGLGAHRHRMPRHGRHGSRPAFRQPVLAGGPAARVGRRLAVSTCRLPARFCNRGSTPGAERSSGTASTTGATNWASIFRP